MVPTTRLTGTAFLQELVETLVKRWRGLRVLSPCTAEGARAVRGRMGAERSFWIR